MCLLCRLVGISLFRGRIFYGYDMYAGFGIFLVNGFAMAFMAIMCILEKSTKARMTIQKNWNKLKNMCAKHKEKKRQKLEDKQQNRLVTDIELEMDEFTPAPPKEPEQPKVMPIEDFNLQKSECRKMKQKLTERMKEEQVLLRKAQDELSNLQLETKELDSLLEIYHLNEEKGGHKKRQETLALDLKERQMAVHHLITSVDENKFNMTPEEWASIQEELATIQQELRSIPQEVVSSAGLDDKEEHAVAGEKVNWTPPPLDKAKANLIELIAKRTSTYMLGSSVEAQMRQRHIGSEDYDFLFEGNDSNDYYKWCKQCAKDGIEPRDHDSAIGDIFSDIDTSGNGIISFEEFADWSREVQPGAATDKSLEKARALYKKHEEQSSSGGTGLDMESFITFFTEMGRAQPTPYSHAAPGDGDHGSITTDIFHSIDTSANGIICFDEFAEWSRRTQPGAATEQSLAQAFKLFADQEQKGGNRGEGLDLQHFIAFFGKLRQNAATSQGYHSIAAAVEDDVDDDLDDLVSVTADIFRAIDTSNNGIISFEEFADWSRQVTLASFT